MQLVRNFHPTKTNRWGTSHAFDGENLHVNANKLFYKNT